MYWLSRPPYHRWLAAIALVITAAVMDLSDRATTPFPFAARTIPAGTAVADAIEWRDVPEDLLGPVPRMDAVAIRDLAAGEPIVAGAVSDALDVPRGWWSVPVEVPDTASVGAKVRLVAVDPPLDVEGIVAAAGEPGPFGSAAGGLVAVPPETAAAVAAAVSTGNLLVLLGT